MPICLLQWIGPQRTERLGWTGDANFYLTTAAFNFDMCAFYEKWESDMLTDGQFSNAAPGWYPEDSQGTGGGWGDAGMNVPYTLWQRYDDREIVRRSYSGMQKWIEFLLSKSPGLITNGDISAPGDWKNAGEDTPKDLIATAYFAHDVQQLAQMAAAIHKLKDALDYSRLFLLIRKAFENRFVQPDGTVGSGSQTSYVLALELNLIQQALRKAAAAKLAENIERHGRHLTTGFVGTQWLLSVLSESGRPDLAYALLAQTSAPSWGNMLSHGTTTIWETWDVIASDGSFPQGPYSLNHCALGSCGEWMYQEIGGLVPDPSQPGYKHFFIAPKPELTRLTDVSTRFKSVQGQIGVRWDTRGEKFHLEVDIPVNTTATLSIPGTNRKEDGLKSVAKTVTIGSGHYDFNSTLNL